MTKMVAGATEWKTGRAYETKEDRRALLSPAPPRPNQQPKTFGSDLIGTEL